MGTIGCAVVGYGYWGPNLARNISQVDGAKLEVICDLDTTRLDSAAKQHPATRTTSDFGGLLTDPNVDAVILATEPSNHRDLGTRILQAGKHLLVEKPLATTAQECDALIEAADRSGTTLMTGHTFVYNPAIIWLKGFLDSNGLGDIYYIYSQRLSLGKVRPDVNVLWDLAPHDLSILTYLVDSPPVAVSATLQSHLDTPTAEVGFLIVEFANGIQSHIHVSWLDPRKVRRTTLVGSDKMVVYDDTDLERRIQIYDKGIDVYNTPDDHAGFGEHHMQLRAGDILVPALPTTEPLRNECEEFISAIRDARKPLTDGKAGRDVVAILEAACSRSGDISRTVSI